MEVMRPDGRMSNQIRPYSVEYGVIHEPSAIGSARWTQGRTEILVSVHGPSQPRYNRHEMYNQMTLELDIHRVGSSDRSRKESHSIEMSLHKSLLSCIDVERYPRTILLIKVSIIKDDGSLYGNIFNACIVALLDSSIAMTCTPLATQMSYSNEIQGLLLDPTYDEEISSNSSIFVVTKPLTESTYGIVSIITQGKLNTDLLDTICDLSSKCSQRLGEFIRGLFLNME